VALDEGERLEVGEKVDELMAALGRYVKR